MSAVPATPFVPGGRLERFRAARARLDPAGDPADAKAFYVDTPHAVSSRIAAELAVAPASTHLLIGGVGSGKTTELLAIEQRIAAFQQDVATLYVDVSKRHDIAKMIPGALIAQVGLGLAEELERNGHRSGVTAEAKAVALGTWVPSGYADEHARDAYEDPGVHFPGILVPPTQVASAVLRARAPLEKMLPVLRNDARHLVVMLDGLDRLTDLQALEHLVHHDVKTLTSLEIGVVLVGPLRALYGLDRVLVQLFDSFHYQPWIDVTRSSAGREFLAGVLNARATDAFDAPAIEPLVAASGGVLRDLLSLTQSALVEAYMRGSDRVGPHEVGDATETFGRKHLQGIRATELDVLQRVRTAGEFVQTSEEDLALLMTRRVLEYRTDNRPRYAVHPTIEPLLRALEE